MMDVKYPDWNEKVLSQLPKESFTIDMTHIARPWKKETHGHANRPHNPHYHTAYYKKDRDAFMAANPICVECQKEGRIEPSTISDHSVPIHLGGDPWDWSNRQALCDSHHNRKSAKERKQ